MKTIRIQAVLSLLLALVFCATILKFFLELFQRFFSAEYAHDVLRHEPYVFHQATEADET